jgi:hypothetical protein
MNESLTQKQATNWVSTAQRFGQVHDVILAALTAATAGLDAPTRNTTPGAITSHGLVRGAIAGEYLPWAELHAALVAEGGPIDDTSDWPDQAQSEFLAVVGTHLRMARGRIERRQDTGDAIQIRLLSKAPDFDDVQDMQAYALELLRDAGDRRFVAMLDAASETVTSSS